MRVDNVARKKDSTSKNALVNAILEQYQPQTVEDMQDALQDIFGPMFEAMLQGEMKSHIGYESNDHNKKKLQTVEMDIPRKQLKQPMEMFLLKYLVIGMLRLNHN